MLPHVVVQITFGHELLLANFTTVWFLALMFDPNVLVDRSLVKYLRAYWTPGIVVGFLALWHKVTLVFHSDMSCEAARVDKHLQTVSAFLWNLFMFSLLVPV